jgi:hypothetical protein
MLVVAAGWIDRMSLRLRDRCRDGERSPQREALT